MYIFFNFHSFFSYSIFKSYSHIELFPNIFYLSIYPISCFLYMTLPSQFPPFSLSMFTYHPPPILREVEKMRERETENQIQQNTITQKTIKHRQPKLPYIFQNKSWSTFFVAHYFWAWLLPLTVIYNLNDTPWTKTYFSFNNRCLWALQWVPTPSIHCRDICLVWTCDDHVCTALYSV